MYDFEEMQNRAAAIETLGKMGSPGLKPESVEKLIEAADCFVKDKSVHYISEAARFHGSETWDGLLQNAKKIANYVSDGLESSSRTSL